MVEFPTVILAGGEGRRMGGGKPLRRLDGRTLIERAVALAGTWSDEVAVAVRDPGQVGDLDVLLIQDREDIPGPLGGLAAALAWAAGQGHDRVLTIPCDAPRLPADLAQRLDAAFVSGVGAVMAESGGRAHPTCTLWRTDAADQILAAGNDGRRSLHAAARRAGSASVDWPDDADFFNINTPQELASASAARRP